MPQIIIKQRRIPSSGMVLVQEGERVYPHTVIAEIEQQPGALTRLPAAQLLGIPTEQIADRVVALPDVTLQAGDLLAENTTFFCLKELRCNTDCSLAFISSYLGYLYLRNKSAHSSSNKPLIFRATDYNQNKLLFVGDFNLRLNDIVNPGEKIFDSHDIMTTAPYRVSLISYEEGTVVLTPLFPTVGLTAQLEGFVQFLPDSDICCIVSYGHRYQGMVGYGGEACGPLRPLLALERDLEAKDIPADIADSIIVARSGASIAALQTLAVRGAAGLILGSLNMDLLQSFSGQDPLQQLGTLMTLPYPIVLMQGFSGTIPNEVYRQISTCENMVACLDATTQLRAGISRPELLIALPQQFPPMEQMLTEALHAEDIVNIPLRIGEAVRLVREPGMGRQCRLLDIDGQLRQTEAGNWAVLATVQSEEDGQRMRVPLNNCQHLTVT